MPVSQQNYSSSKTNLFVALALFVIPISGLAIDIYVPSLPAVSDYFHVNKAYAQLSISIYMMGLGFMQLFAGPITDSFGRRKPFMVAMLIFVVVTFFITLINNINILLLCRFIQGVSIACLVVPIRSVLPDLFHGKNLYKMMNYMTMAWSIGPIIAPAIGGYLQHYLGWQSNFYFLFIYGLSAFMLIGLFLPETSKHHHAFHFETIIGNYKSILINKTFLTALAMNSILYSLIIIFSMTAPFIIQTVLHYSAIMFGQIALLTGLAWFLGTMTNRLLFEVDVHTKAKVCLTSMLIVAILNVFSAIFLPLTIYNCVIPVLFLLFLGGCIFPNNFAVIMSLFPKVSGSANSLFGGFLFLISGCISGMGSYLKSDSLVPLALAYLALISVSFLLMCFGHKINSPS